MKKSKLNEFLKHVIECENYGNITKDEAVKLLQSLYTDVLKELRKKPYILNKKMYKDIMSEIEFLLKNYKTDLKGIYENSFENITTYQSSWLKDFLKDTGKNIIIPVSILSSVKFSPIANVTDYLNIIENEVYKIQESIDTSLKLAYITKEDMSQVADRFEKRESKFEASVIKDTKTVNTAAFNTTSYLIYKSNDIDVVYCSVLDSGTCFDCGLDNGKIFKVSEAPILPKHYGCRCTLVPKDVVGEDDMPESYVDWINELSDEERYEVLGKARYELYNAGFPVKHFVDDDGKTIPVKELKQ